MSIKKGIVQDDMPLRMSTCVLNERAGGAKKMVSSSI